MDVNKNNNTNTTNVVYAIVGIMTLMITISGATFAYFMATAGNNATITGNMATVTFNMNVSKKTTAGDDSGLIPMTNSMVEKAVSNASSNGICIDDNGNAVCQVYKISVVNSGTSSLFVDGFVTLTGGSGTSKDVTTATTTMRWAQVFCKETNNVLSSCTTEASANKNGTATTRTATAITWNALGSNQTSTFDTNEIKESGVTGVYTINANNYNLINTNYIRISKYTKPASGRSYTNNDITSALVFNQYLTANDNNANNNDGDSSNTYTDSQVYYIVIWLSETGTNQTIGSGEENVPTSGINFFQGNVTFISAQGHEITATFNNYTAVTPIY